MTTLPPPAPPEPNWEGHKVRDCGDHRTVGRRAWCHDDGEWCYQSAPCRGCELPTLRDLAYRLAVELARHGWGDFHYSNDMRQEPQIVALLEEYHGWTGRDPREPNPDARL